MSSLSRGGFWPIPEIADDEIKAHFSSAFWRKAEIAEDLFKHCLCEQSNR